MNVIKGLVIKDLLQLKSYKRTITVFMITFILVSLVQQSEGNIRNMPVLLMVLGFSMFSIASFSYDEMAKSDRYILSLPIIKKEVVLSKYVFIIGSTIIGSVLGIIISFITTLIINKQVSNIIELICFSLRSNIWNEFNTVSTNSTFF